jgi:hypothetical protein
MHDVVFEMEEFKSLPQELRDLCLRVGPSS